MIVVFNATLNNISAILWWSGLFNKIDYYFVCLSK